MPPVFQTQIVDQTQILRPASLVSDDVIGDECYIRELKADFAPDQLQNWTAWTLRLSQLRGPKGSKKGGGVTDGGIKY